MAAHSLSVTLGALQTTFLAKDLEVDLSSLNLKHLSLYGIANYNPTDVSIFISTILGRKEKGREGRGKVPTD